MCGVFFISEVSFPLSNRCRFYTDPIPVKEGAHTTYPSNIIKELSIKNKEINGKNKVRVLHWLQSRFQDTCTKTA